MVTTATSPTGAGVTKDLINWMKSIFGKPFTVSRGYSPPGTKNFHDGVDLPAPKGTPVFALSSGVVSYARDARSDSNAGKAWAIGGGKVVNIDIGNKFTTQYAHLDTINVKEGQRVIKGQQIGTVGMTGFTVGRPHLHFGLWDRNINKMVNPDNFFKNLGDTSPSGIVTNGFNDILKQLGISTDPNHVLTHDEAAKIADVYAERFNFQKGSSVWNEILRSFEGKNVATASQDQSLNPIDNVGAAITGIGAQLVDTFTWLGFILIGIIFLIGAFILVKPTGNE